MGFTHKVNKPKELKLRANKLRINQIFLVKSYWKNTYKVNKQKELKPRANKLRINQVFLVKSYWKNTRTVCIHKCHLCTECTVVYTTLNQNLDLS